MSGRFHRVVVIGCGKIAGTALKYVAGLREAYGFALSYIQHEIQEMTPVHRICAELGIENFSIPEKKCMTEMLMAIQEPALIISAGNHYIFPKKVLEKSNITIINFHNALLPKYPGRNAPSWAIYSGEKESGATWHMVTEGVDSGGIIWQGSCEITQDMKAYELVAKIMELAQQGLESFLEKLLVTDVEVQPQIQNPERVMYYSKDVPAEGMVHVNDEVEYVYRTLRAMDYGKMGPFPPLVLQLEDGSMVEVLRYKKVSRIKCEENSLKENCRVLPFHQEAVLQIKYKPKES